MKLKAQRKALGLLPFWGSKMAEASVAQMQ
jgi:hypothetical protein